MGSASSEEGMVKVLRAVAFVVRYEWHIWRSLVVALLRLRRAPEGAQPHRYAGAMTPIMIVFIVVSAIELPIVHLLLPWETVRLVVDVLSVYGLVWMFGLLAAVWVHPHYLDDDGLHVRSGFSVHTVVPWEAIASVRAKGRGAERRGTVHSVQTPTGEVASVVVLKQTNVDIVLSRSTVLELAKLGGRPVTELRLFADDPDALAKQVRARLATSATPATPPTPARG